MVLCSSLEGKYAEVMTKVKRFFEGIICSAASLVALIPNRGECRIYVRWLSKGKVLESF